MKQIIKFIITSVLLIFLILPMIVSAANVGDVISDLDKTAQNAKIIESPENAATVYGITGQIIFLLLGVLGVIFLVLMIYGGLTWMTAAGNEEKVKKARTTLVHATLGLLILLTAFILTNYVIFQILEKTTTPQIAEQCPPQCCSIGSTNLCQSNETCRKVGGGSPSDPCAGCTCVPNN